MHHTTHHNPTAGDPMSTTIEWTDRTWNPTTGCDRVSAGCDHCYALTMAKRLKGMGSAKYQRDGNPKTSGPGFGLSAHADVLSAPLTWSTPQKVFVNSMSDLFHKDVPEDFIARVWTVMAKTPQHTYQILTKRHDRMRSIVRRIAWRSATTEERQRGVRGSVAYVQQDEKLNDHLGTPRVLPNVWLGCSVEDQKWADIRIPALLETPAKVRFISAEPLIGAVDLNGQWLDGECAECQGAGTKGWDEWQCIVCAGEGTLPRLHWVIAGGESGPGARPMHPDWARLLRDQCTGAGVPFLFKQWGAWAPTRFVGIGNQGPRFAYVGDPVDKNGHRAVMERVGKKAAGRELDGRTWDEYPASATATAVNA
jgi:protein gp37